MKRYQIAAVAVIAYLAVACGQYAGVHEAALEQLQTEGAAVLGGTTAGGTGIATTGGGTGAGGGGGGGAGSTTGGTTTGPGGGSSASGSSSVPQEGDTTGITSTTITIGIHAPLTGAAPLRAESFNTGKDLYWEKGNNGKPVLIGGKWQVRVVFRDDQYNPSHARDVCQEMAEQDKAFLLIGGGGTDQIQACAQYAASQGIPYLSAGVTENGMRELRNYFAASMSYPQQAPLLADYIKSKQSEFDWNGEAARVAMVATDTPNFDDAVNAFTQAMPGIQVYRPAKNERGQTMAGNLCTGASKNFDVVFPLVAPTYYLEMAGAAKCNPQYAGVGVTMGLDQVAFTGCETGGAEGARFFSPTPAFADSDDFDPAFRDAGGEDDIMWLLWGLSKTLHILFENATEATNGNLNREGFVAATEQASAESGVYPDLHYSPDDHFGASQVNVLRAVCQGDGHYETEEAFADSF